MPDFLPFRGLRYRGATDLRAVVAPPYDVIDEEERRSLEDSDPHNAVRLILPRAEGGDDPYTCAARTLAQWRGDGTLETDAASRFYGYRMTFDDDGITRRTVGIIGALALAGDQHDVLPHERTMPKARSDRLALLEATRANFDPIWGLSLGEGLSDLVPDGPVTAWAVDATGTRHELVVIDAPEAVERITTTVRSAPVMIADGHHRFETACAFRDRHPDAPGADAIMALVVELSDEQLSVHAIHRILLGGGAAALRTHIGDAFDVTDAGPNTPDGVRDLVARMQAEGGLGIVDDDGLALAVPHSGSLDELMRDLPEVVHDVDAARFEAVIRPALGDVDVTYRNDATRVAALVAEGAADGAVLLRPVTVAQIREAAFADVRMPQKTTFFHPKPRTGMVLRSLDG